MIEDFLKTLEKSGLDFTEAQLSDLLWLAQYIKPEEVTTSKSFDSSVSSSPQTPPPSPMTTPPLATPQPKHSQKTTKAELHLKDNSDSQKGYSSINFTAPAASALPAKVEIGRALRPFKRRRLNTNQRILDETATANRIAEEKIWIPILKPAITRWFEVALIVDENISMAVWQQTIVELAQLLTRHGAFRNVRIWSLDTSSETEVVLRARPHFQSNKTTSKIRSAPATHYKNLIDPQGQRLIIIVSDCVGPAWFANQVTPLLETWGKSNPLVILQVLPQRLWLHTALGAYNSGLLHASAVGVANHQLNILDYDDIFASSKDLRGLLVPIVTLEPSILASWSSLVAQAQQKWVPLLIVNTSWKTELSYLATDYRVRSNPSNGLSAREQIESFEATATPTTRELARLLSVLPISLPIINLVQEAMLPHSRQVHVAELLLSGLLQPIVNHPDPNYIQYDFSSLEIRQILFSRVKLSEVTHLLEKTSSYIAKRAGQLRSFQVGLKDSTIIDSEKDFIAASSKQFANISTTILQRLGSRYADFINHLQEQVAYDDNPESPQLPELILTSPQTPIVKPSGPIYINSGSAAHNFKRHCPKPPAPPDYFGGRDVRLTALASSLKSGFTNTIVAVAGLGGIGKTTLALKAANDLYDQKVFRAVLWADVGREPQVLTLLENWARYADSSFQLATDRPLAAVALQVKALLEEVITEKCQECQPEPSLNRVLVVIDDVWESGIEATRILKQACPANATVLLTTRSQKVANTLGARVQAIDRLNATEALDLLSQYLPESNLAQLNELGQTLGGHPLALTLAARRIRNAEDANKALTAHLKEYATKLPQGIEFQQLELDQAAGREDNLTLVLSYSYTELKRQDQTRFRALGALVYDQPFDKEMLAALWDLEGTAKEKELEAACNALRLASLIELDYSLASTSVNDNNDADKDDKVWYRQHPLFHAYTHALLINADAGKEIQTVTERYHQYVTKVITAKFWEFPPEQWGREINPYLPHVFSVGKTLVELFQQIEYSGSNTETTTTPETKIEQLQLIQLFAINTSRYLGQRREVQQMDWLEMGLQSSRALADQKEEARFLNEIGMVYSDLGDNSLALEYYQQALVLSIRRAVEDRGGEATTLNNIGSVYSDLGENGKALEYYEQALSIRRAVGDRGSEASTLSNIGHVYSDLGEPDKALEYYEQALSIRRAVEDRGGEASTLSNIGRVYSDLGENRKALEYFNQALPLRRVVGDRRGEATTLNNIGRVYSDLGEPDKALEYYEQALLIQRAVNDRRGEAVTSYNIASIYYGQGQLAQAIEYLTHCIELDKQVQHPDLANNEALLAEWQQELAGKPQK
jgi:tetratricopeptide (TPR) repeat protein